MYVLYVLQVQKGEAMAQRQDTVNEFILLRAQGLSYDKIAKKLKIGRATCSNWDSKYMREIADRKAEELNALYEEYFMGHKARIKRLGGICNKLDEEINKRDFSQIPLEKLLELRLKYGDALKQEHTGGSGGALPADATPSQILQSIILIYNRTRSGELTEAQARQEITMLAGCLKAIDAGETQKRIEELETILIQQQE